MVEILSALHYRTTKLVSKLLSVGQTGKAPTNAAGGQNTASARIIALARHPSM
jgi:hypothetical protein